MAQFDAVVARCLEPGLHVRQVGHILIEHPGQRGPDQVAGGGERLTIGDQEHRRRLGRFFALGCAHQDTHFHQAVIGITPRPPAVHDIGRKAAPRRPVGENIVREVIEHLAVGNSRIVEAICRPESFTPGLCENLAREPRIGRIEPAQVFAFGHATFTRTGIAAAGEVSQRLEDVELILALKVRRKRGRRRDRAVHVIAVKIIAGVGIGGEAQDLRVRDD